MKRIAFILSVVLFALLSCNKTNNKPGGGGNDDPENQAPISIDGKFEDWVTLDGAVIAKNDPESNWAAVKELRVYAYDDYVYYYIRFDGDYMKEFFEANDVLPARVNLNTDGEFTSGYPNYFNQAYDFMIEMSLGNGAGGWGTADDSTLYQRIDSDWTELLGQNSGLTFGAGSGMEYELFVDRSIFNTAVAKSSIPMPMGDNFQTSMRYYETTTDAHWAELSNMPNSSTGYGDLMDINFVK